MNVTLDEPPMAVRMNPNAVNNTERSVEKVNAAPNGKSTNLVIYFTFDCHARNGMV